MSASSEEKSEKEKSAFNIIKNWFLNSPTHGIRRISHANSILGRLFWSTTFLIFTALMCIFIYTVVRKYIANPTKISLSVRQYRDQKHIPTITFCNLNPLRDDKFLDNGKNRSRSNYTDEEYQQLFSGYMYELLAKSINKSQPRIAASGYQLKDLLIRCVFNGQSCRENFTSFLHPSYGNCFTLNYSSPVEIQENFNSNFWSDDDDEIGEHGYKLFLELYLYQNEDISNLNDRTAFRIFIHHKNEIPVLSENSLFLAPKTFTKLIFSQRFITFSQNCRKDLTDNMKQLFRPDSVRYSQALCFRVCEFRYIAKHCDCTDQSFMVFFPFISQNETNQINTNKSCLVNNKCLDQYVHFNAKQSCPQCLSECELIQYTIQSSYADYPNLRSAEKVLLRIENHFKEIGYSPILLNTSKCLNNRKESLLDDIVAVEISASPYATEVLAESPMYTWVDLISSIGGQAGLWIGVSLISFVEIVELLFLLFCHFIKKICDNILNRWKNFSERVFVRKLSTKL